jgi:hypothetical protein
MTKFHHHHGVFFIFYDLVVGLTNKAPLSPAWAEAEPRRWDKN